MRLIYFILIAVKITILTSETVAETMEYCPEVKPPDYSIYRVSNSSLEVGTIVLFYCITNFLVTPANASVVECLPGGTWNLTFPKCVADPKRSECKEPEFPENSIQVGVKDTYHIFDVVELSCRDGFGALGNATLQCNQYKKWNVNFSCVSLCEPYHVPSHKVVNDSQKATYYENDTLQIRCLDCYTDKKGSNYVTCRDFSWESSDPLVCSQPACPSYNPAPDRNVVVLGTNLPWYHVGSKITLICQDGYLNFTSYSNEVTCLDCNSWDDSLMSCCKSCPDVIVNETVVNVCVGANVRLDSTGTNLTCLNCDGTLEWHTSSCDRFTAFYEKNPELFYIPIIGFIVVLLLGVTGCLVYRQYVYYSYQKRSVSPGRQPMLAPDSTARERQLSNMNTTFSTEQSLVSTRDIVIIDHDVSMEIQELPSTSSSSDLHTMKSLNLKRLVERRLSEISF